MEKYEQLEHNCSVIFFTPGRFKANIECATRPQQSNSILTRSCPEATNLSQLGKMSSPPANLNTISTSGLDEHQAYIWKFIPPIEVTVVEP